MDNQEQPKKGSKWLTWLAVILVLAAIGRCMGESESEDDKFIRQYHECPLKILDTNKF